MNRKSDKPETRCIHAGNTVDSVTGAVMPAIYTSSTFENEAFGVPREYIYSRGDNPTRAALERCAAELEGGLQAFGCASGMAATAAVLDLLPAGAHVVVPNEVYGGTYRLLTDIRAKSAGIEASFVDFSSPDNIAAACKDNTALVWFESPTNPLLSVLDIQAIADVAHAHGALAAVDNTFATPMNQRPLELGCDIVMHSTTKYFGGHSDVLGGLVIVSDAELGERLSGVIAITGGVAGPFDAYLTFRGIKTMALRMERHQSNALAIAQWLEGHKKVSRVIYPGLSSHPGHELASRQMDQGYGAVVALELNGKQADVAAFMNKLQYFAIAEGLGGVESLVGHPRTMSHSRVPEDQKDTLGLTENLVRLSVGIEHVDDLIGDLDQAL
ncbi:MAG: PLP-dependent transferase [Gammaproteobacteria bacterium]|nr:PLP-dependent transferase [Gammaproteobacteria bacterium]MCP4089547.1 PLP-dependent transferase [Gammaproteobacteria bacterium]MCP4276253.1 PLP-dependent transferase [Gammaproteobacteria bacterium]MCP4832950.1 PLP-dependent transferase [Gammaproteobacteria bacterium]MCP4930075.1 PLP-dependent transferase [Gammaproteobacteria bacterium]